MEVKSGGVISLPLQGGTASFLYKEFHKLLGYEVRHLQSQAVGEPR